MEFKNYTTITKVLGVTFVDHQSAGTARQANDVRVMMACAAGEEGLGCVAGVGER